MESSDKLTMCRLCLCENDSFINIFDLNDWQGYVAAEVISDLLQFQVSETDLYPHVVCSKCLMKLTDFMLFKKCCQNSIVTYDKMFLSSESLEEHKPEIDIDDIGGGLELHEQHPQREASPEPIIKQEEVDIDSSSDGSEQPFEGTSTQASFGPIILKHEIISFSKDSHTQDEVIESMVFGNANAVEPAATSIDNSTQYEGAMYYHTVNKIEKDVELLDYGVELGINVQDSHQSTTSSGKKVAKGSQDKKGSSQDGINAQGAAYTCRDSHSSSISAKCKGAVDAYSCPRNICSDDESIFNKSKHISSCVEVEESSSGTVQRLEGQWILSGERMYMPSFFQKDMGIGKNWEEGREKKETGGEVEGCRETALEKEVEGVKEKLECYHCGNMFTTKSVLTAHMILHGFGNSYDCKICGKMLQSNSKLIMHGLTHTGSKPYKCTECSKCYGGSSSLKRHMRLHTGSKPFNCSECNKSFSQSGELKRHIMTHTGSKPYKCEECSKCFSQKGDLKKHIRSHTGSRPYKCAECSKCFRVTSSLRRHMRLHLGSKPFKCDICYKRFTDRSNFKNHLIVHAKEKPHECHNCRRRFTLPRSLKTHLDKYCKGNIK